jgi:hypothetical protein
MVNYLLLFKIQPAYLGYEYNMRKEWTLVELSQKNQHLFRP